MSKQQAKITVFGNDGNAKHHNRIEINGALDARGITDFCGYIARELGSILGHLSVLAERAPDGSVTVSMRIPKPYGRRVDRPSMPICSRYCRTSPIM